MIDTNILLDWLLNRDPARTKRIDTFLAKNQEVHIPDLVLVEVVFALEKYYELPRTIVARNLSKILEESSFNCNRQLFYSAITDYTNSPSLSFIDCCLLKYAELQKDLPLWTFDKKLVSQSSGRAELLS